MTLAVRLAAVAVLLAGAVVSDAQLLPQEAFLDIVTDRPDITESSVVVPKASVQAENGLTWTADHGNQALDAAETLMRFGLLTRTEFRIVVPNYFESISASNGVSGFGDLGLGIKQQLGPLRGNIDLSMIAALSLPTGADRVSTHGFDPFIKFPWSRELPGGWSVGGMQSLFWFTLDGRRNFTWEPTLYLEREVAKGLVAFAEYGADFPALDRAKHVAHLGTAYKLTRKQQVDFHFGFGLSHTAPSRFFAIGYSFRVDSLWRRGQP